MAMVLGFVLLLHKSSLGGTTDSLEQTPHVAGKSRSRRLHRVCYLLGPVWRISCRLVHAGAATHVAAETLRHDPTTSSDTGSRKSP